MYDLNGKVALITGAGGEHGIGRAIATRLAKEGADVIVNDVVDNPYPPFPPAGGGNKGGTSDWEGAPSVVREIEALGRRAMAILADVSDVDQVDALVDEGVERMGHIDIFVCNAARVLVPIACQWSSWGKRRGIPYTILTSKGHFFAAERLLGT